MIPHATIQLVFSTLPDRAQAEALGRRLVEERHAACATALPGAVSVYPWKGNLERTGECLLLLKTTTEALDGLERRLLELHPYECPEFFAVEASRVSPDYRDWVKNAVTDGPAAV